MTGNNNAWYAIRSLRTPDLKSGEELLIVYHPKADVVTINGYAVTRSDESAESLVKAIFHRTPTDKPFTVATTSLGELYY